jgi:peptidoglycan/xylan/chitin deacetylase (PgdA/CDA1 family)
MRNDPAIWMYHSVEDVDDDPFQITVSPARFDRQLDWLAARGLRGVGVAELLAARQAGQDRGLVGLTFDDGYADFATWVVPALLRRGFAATVFMVAGEIGGQNGWDTGPRRSLMTDKQLRWVAEQGMEVGSHGLRHLDMPQVGDEALQRELRDSRAILQDVTGRDIGGFAYPYGHVSAREVEAVRAAGYDYGCAIWHSSLTGVHALPRVYVGDHDHGPRLRLKHARHRLLSWRWS